VVLLSATALLPLKSWTPATTILDRLEEDEQITKGQLQKDNPRRTSGRAFGSRTVSGWTSLASQRIK